MSSGTTTNVAAVGQAIRDGNIGTGMSGGPTQVLSSRQMALDFLWRFYRCTNYDNRKYDWNGHEVQGKLEHDQMVSGGVIPPGFYDAGADAPLSFRKPSAPYYLGKIIVDRFTSMLFSAKRHPTLNSHDPATADWLVGFAEATRLWAKMIQARRFGGAMGAVGLGFKFVQGRPIVEVFDPRWCDVELDDREGMVVGSLEIRYQWVSEVRQPDGTWTEVWFWYRRVITSETDTVWPKVTAAAGEEPDWAKIKHIETKHGLGFCPVVWIQNLPVLDDIDGDPDCHGAFDLIEEIDALYSQASLGTKANCDPTLLISSDAEWDAIKKGSRHALQVGAGESASYLEIAGGGIEKAMSLADRLEEKALTVSSCVLDRNEGGPARSVEELDHKYSAMIDQADVLREQYGELGLKRLLEMVLRAARAKGSVRPVKGEDGVTKLVREVVTLPKRVVVGEDGERKYEDRQLGSGDSVEIIWPEYFTIGTDELAKRVDAATKAKQGGLIDRTHAAQFVAKEFGVENLQETLAKAQQEQQEEAAAAMAGMGGGEAEGGEAKEGEQVAPAWKEPEDQGPLKDEAEEPETEDRT